MKRINVTMVRAASDIDGEKVIAGDIVLSLRDEDGVYHQFILGKGGAGLRRILTDYGLESCSQCGSGANVKYKDFGRGLTLPVCPSCYG